MVKLCYVPLTLNPRIAGAGQQMPFAECRVLSLVLNGDERGVFAVTALAHRCQADERNRSDATVGKPRAS